MLYKYEFGDVVSAIAWGFKSNDIPVTSSATSSETQGWILKVCLNNQKITVAIIHARKINVIEKNKDKL